MLQGNGVYHKFITKAIQERVIKKDYAQKFLDLLHVKQMPVLAKEERVNQIVEKFQNRRDKIEEIKRDPNIDPLEKEEMIVKQYDKGAQTLLEDFYAYMKTVDMKVKKRRSIKAEDKNLKLVGFLRLYRLQEWEKNQKV